MNQLQPLPVGIQDFAQLRERGCLYVDKTELVHRLVKGSSAVFLSRPRRFGKSLLCSVFANLYEGRLVADGKAKSVKKVAVAFGTAERNIVKWEIQ